MVDSRVIDTLIAEAGGNPEGLRAVAAVVENRASQWGLTPLQVVQQAGQFEGYSNPGHASKAAQKDASVRAKAERAWNDITSGRVADPTYGGVSFRASYASSGMSAPHGTVTIGGNTFAKGSGSPQTALAAINAAVAPSPQQRPPALAYTSPPSVPAGMIAPGNIDLNNRPVYFGNDGTYGTERSFSIGTDRGEVLIPQIVGGRLLSQQDAIRHYQQTGENLGTFSSPAAADAYAERVHNRDQGLGNMPVPMPQRPAALNVPAAPMQLPDAAMYGIGKPKGTPRTYAPAMTDLGTDPYQVLAGGLGALQDSRTPPLIAPQAAPPPLTSRSVHTVAVDPMTGNPVSSQPRDLQSALNDYAARLGASRTTGGFKTANPQAGNVPLPAGVVPASAQRDMGFLSMLSGQPIAGGATSAPFAPSPGIASGANFATASATPYIPGPRGATSAYKDVAQLPASNTVFDATPAYTEKTVMVPKQVAIPSLPNPSPAILGGLSIANGALPPPQYKTVMVPKTVRVPTVPTPQPPSFPTMVGNGLMNIFNHSAPGHVAQLLTGKPVTGGFLSLLQGNPIQAARLVSNGVLSSPPPVPSQPVGASYLQAQGQNTAGMTDGQVADALKKSMGMY